VRTERALRALSGPQAARSRSRRTTSSRAARGGMVWRRSARCCTRTRYCTSSAGPPPRACRRLQSPDRPAAASGGAVHETSPSRSPCNAARGSHERPRLVAARSAAFACLWSGGECCGCPGRTG
jgi:hypothetical protein